MPKKKRMRRQQDIAVQVGDNAGTRNQFVGHAAVREAESLGRHRAQAIGIDNVVAASKRAGLPGPRDAARRVAGRVDRPDIHRPDGHHLVIFDSDDLSHGREVTASESAMYCGSSSARTPKASGPLPAALVNTLAPVRRCSAAMPPT